MTSPTTWVSIGLGSRSRAWIAGLVAICAVNASFECAAETAAPVQPAQAATIKKLLAQSKAELDGDFKDALRPDGEGYRLRVRLHYDPQSSQTSSLYNTLYINVLKTLKCRPVTIEDVSDDLNIRLSGDKTCTNVDVKYETK